MRSPRPSRTSSSDVSLGWPGAARRPMLVPTISSAPYPNSRSAAGFQLVIVPSSDWLKIASSADRTIAANRPSSDGLDAMGASLGWISARVTGGRFPGRIHPQRRLSSRHRICMVTDASRIHARACAIVPSRRGLPPASGTPNARVRRVGQPGRSSGHERAAGIRTDESETHGSGLHPHMLQLRQAQHDPPQWAGRPALRQLRHATAVAGQRDR